MVLSNEECIAIYLVLKKQEDNLSLLQYQILSRLQKIIYEQFSLEEIEQMFLELINNEESI